MDALLPAGLYGRAQAMRRDGTAPKTMGIADDLPNRFALEQLSTLAGMASKVRSRGQGHGEPETFRAATTIKKLRVSKFWRTKIMVVSTLPSPATTMEARGRDCWDVADSA